MRLGSRCNVQRGGVIEIVTPRSSRHVKAGASSVTLPIVTQVGGPGCPSQHHQFCKTTQTLVSTLYVRIRHPYDAMSPIDFDNYYAEQEERMDMPDETMQEYLRRVALSKRSPSQNAYTSTSRKPHSAGILASPKGVPQDPSILFATCFHETNGLDGRDSPEDSGRSKKFDAISVTSGLEYASGPSQIGLSPDRDNIRDISDGPESDLTHPARLITNEAKDLQLEENGLSTSMEDIDSFTVSEILNAQLPSRFCSSKRQLSDKEACGRPSKKRRLPQTRSRSPPQVATATELSPSMDPIPAKRSSSRRAETATIPKLTRLNLRPLNETKPSRDQARPRVQPLTGSPESSTSDIEDASLVTNLPALGCAQESLTLRSDMYLEVKERIANHRPTKSRDRVLRPGSKSIISEPRVMAATAEAVGESSVICVSSSPSSRAASPDPVKPSIMKPSDKKKQTQPAVEKKRPKGKKEKATPMTPAEYARMLNEKSAASNDQVCSTSMVPKRRKGPNFKFLEGKNIFYTGGDMKHASETTRKRMDIIVRHGGNLMPNYDPAVTTHIITEAQVLPTLRALGVKRLRDIPDHIPTIKWTWVLSVLGREGSLSKEEIDDKLGTAWMHAAFSERMEAGCQPKSVHPMSSFKLKKVNRQDELKVDTNRTPSPVPAIEAPSSITDERTDSEFLGAPPSPPTSPPHTAVTTKGGPAKAEDPSNDFPSKGEPKKVPTDPLAEFYDQALAQRNNEDGWSSLGEVDMQSANGGDSDRDAPELKKPIIQQKKQWTCDVKQPDQKTVCVNQDIIDKLTELMELHKSKPGDEDHWRAFSYSKAIRALRSYPYRIKNVEEARAIKGVGEKTARKIEEIIQTGDLRRIAYEKTEDVEVSRLFQGIYGVGRSTAIQWYAAGCRTLEDLRLGKGGVKLTAVQEIGLRYYEDINLRMPREEARQIFELIKPIALSIDPKLFIEIMGSYRRGKATCGDIDILITRPTDDGLTHRGVLPRLLRELHAAGILTEDLATLDNPNDLEGIYRGLCRLPNEEGSKRRRIDFLTVPWKSRGAALLYYTFNRAMRLKANVLGYSLNQRGLFGNVIRDPRDRRVKMNDGEALLCGGYLTSLNEEAGVLVASETEEEIFKILGVPWQEAHERIRG
ncbi:hypothetical protein CVT26_006719 [Gymnopilus dilepis]|uniref:DNA-directed DNA polymerase n=1 Tax=Gymnopilus dilepis TaxID=231916 RepID=A0A409W0J0_9AGAR|nr:hypothetical protein CVT26_006719 [Gymnopilus dilepis]